MILNRSLCLHGIFQTGMILFIIANVARWVLSAPRGPAWPQDAVDAGLGLLFGISIGCMLVGLAARSRRA